MSWYNQINVKLDMNKPIIAQNDKIKCLLVPQLKSPDNLTFDYNGKIIGYNWLNLATGRYNSSCFFKTAEEAIKSYEERYRIRNVTEGFEFI